MSANLQQLINSNDFGVDIEFFQLVQITLPPALVTVISEKQNIAQEIVTATKSVAKSFLLFTSLTHLDICHCFLFSNRANDLIQAETLYLQAIQAAQVVICVGRDGTFCSFVCFIVSVNLPGLVFCCCLVRSLFLAASYIGHHHPGQQHCGREH